jgi:DNA-3-methyladenine glycosylase
MATDLAERLAGPDVVRIARDLLGVTLVSRFDGVRTAVRIVETEAYRAADDRACHAHLGRFTKRTKTMFEPAGTAYVYLCYGIHHLFNIVVSDAGTANAVLIRAGEPLEGLETMRERRRGRSNLASGPGVLTQALGIRTVHDGTRLFAPDAPFTLEPGRPPARVVAGPRIGVDYAGPCAARPWRFMDADSRAVSRPRPA